MTEKRKKKSGRNPKTDPPVFRYTLRFNAKENKHFLTMFEKSGTHAYSTFFKKHFFGQPLRVFTEDKSLLDYYTKLSSLHAQYRAVGNNYNQVVKELKCHFSEKKAMALLYKLEKYTQELAALTHEVIGMTKKYEEKWLQKLV